MKKTTCPRGHIFYKTSNCPVCPKCWSGYYKDKHKADFPKLPAPALRALINAKIFNLHDLSKNSKVDILNLHGMGPSSIPLLMKALKEKKLSFKTN